jgi:DNA replication protein DnaC
VTVRKQTIRIWSRSLPVWRPRWPRAPSIAWATRIKSARFPALKSFESFDFSLLPSLDKGAALTLGSAAFVAARENIVCLGASGTGKTHVAIAIGLAAIYADARVRFTTAVTISQELLAAADERGGRVRLDS